MQVSTAERECPPSQCDNAVLRCATQMCAADGPVRLPEYKPVIFQNQKISPMLGNLRNFCEKIEVARGSDGKDPNWFVVNIYGARGGRRCSLDLLEGIPVEPKCNPVHRYSVQYLEDQNLLDMLASSTCDSHAMYDLVVSNVGYCCAAQPCLNKALFGPVNVKRLAFICVSDEGSLGFAGPIMSSPVTVRMGAVIGLSMLNIPIDASHIRCGKGQFICVAFGDVVKMKSSSKYDHNQAPINAKVELRSIAYPGVVTTPRKNGTVFEKKVACPDCRRAITVATVDTTHNNVAAISSVRPLNQPSIVVSMLLDLSQLDKVIEIGLNCAEQSLQRVLIVPKPLQSLLASSGMQDRVAKAWSKVIAVTPLSKHLEKRGMYDHTVGTDAVSPALFPRSLEGVLHSQAYTVMRVFSLPEFDGKVVRIILPDCSTEVTIRSSLSLYKRMMCELQDWSHPCHRGRPMGAIEFIQEWIDAFGIN